MTQTQVQTQRLSPLQIQTIKLLELPVQDLEQRVRQELEENPVLEDAHDDEQLGEGRGDVSLDAIKEDDYIPEYRTRVSNWGKDPRPEYNTFSVKESFADSLIEQLGYRNLDDYEFAIARFIVGSLDEDGYLRRDLESIVDDLAFRAGIEAERKDVDRMLEVVQECEPAGVGARDLRECLMLQLGKEKDSAAYRILDKAFDEFTAKHFNNVMQICCIDEDELKEALKRISKLNPAPGGQVDDSYIDAAQQIVPDFVLEEQDGGLTFSMPRSNIPEIRVNQKYADMLMKAEGGTEKEQKDAATFVKMKLDAAKWFVEAIKQRQTTLRKTMQAILDYQKEFFLSGDEQDLRPMILEDIANISGYDISTISRVVNSKYIDTPFGIFQLKYFFSEGIVGADGVERSTRGIKKALQDIIEAEDKTSPLTDEQLVAALGEKGYIIARRTVAKYREQLNIPLARFRKSF